MDSQHQESLLELLGQLDGERRDGKVIPPTVFNALLQVLPQTGVEFVVCRRTPSGGVEVLLVQRPLDIPSYPGEWHCPGGFFRVGDTVETVYERIRTGKMGGATIKNIRFLDFQVYSDPIRGGTFIRLVHLVEIEGEPPTGQFFPFLPKPQLPEKIVWEQRPLLEVAHLFIYRGI